ncbi:gypsy retrotransposon integrase-like protein 1 [Plakobranchus ocellatus]|uniref:Gypsy retrotransposon integrase-like protein 1 n=1 Tax=Plakobranchus ocellatus TaxID=259542 RepID=A0AAV4D0D3_9GAST|nr:gypsy retrotransposon integrase-like protein 1 [Plakobranchus ocellatus]
MAEKKLRAQAKTNLTRATSNLQEVLELGSENVTLERLEFLVSDFELKLRSFDEKQSAFELTFDSEEEMNIEIESGNSYRSEKTNILIKVKELINNVKGAASEKASDRSSASVSGDSFTRNKHVNLPRLHLPKFGGDILEFQEFWDQFTAIIDNREEISDVNKFSYLQSLLLGNARSCLQGLALTAVNYDTAKEILLRRFGRTEKVIVAHIQKLLNISAKATLWEIYDQVQVHVRSLANLNVTGQNYGLVLAPIILQQLPHGVRLEWARTGEGKEGDVEYLLNFLYEEIQRRERSSQLDLAADRSSTSGKSEVRKKSPKTTGSGLIASGGDTSSSNKKCGFCSQPHYSDKCPSIKGRSADQRKEKVKSMKLCFKCLSTKHSARSCQKTCFFCRGPHHSTLHRHQDQFSAGGSAQFRDSRHPVQQHPRDQHQFGSPNSPPFIPGSYRAAGTHLPAPSQNRTDTHHACYSQSSARGKSTLRPQPDCGWVLGWCWELEAGGWWIMERQSWCQYWFV